MLRIKYKSFLIFQQNYVKNVIIMQEYQFNKYMHL